MTTVGTINDFAYAANGALDLADFSETGNLGWALILNRLAACVLRLLRLPSIWSVVVFQERELRDRFGETYAEYSRRVLRFAPRLGAPCG